MSKQQQSWPFGVAVVLVAMLAALVASGRHEEAYSYISPYTTLMLSSRLHNEVYNYLSPAATAILVSTLMPRRFKSLLLWALAIFTAASVVFHAYRRKLSVDESVGSKIALVTGASSGIGAEMAKQLARRGYGLVCVARREEKLRDLEKEIRDAGLPSDRPIHLIKADLSAPSEAERVYNVVTKELDLTLSILVNNAGIGFTEDFLNMPIDKIDQLVNLNVVASTKLTHYFATDFAKRGWGRIAVVSSIAGGAPGPHVAVYSATKAYLTSFTLALQHELEGVGVSVTCVIPGATFTDFETAANAKGALAFWLPGIAMSAHDVATESVEAIIHGHSMVVPGLVNKLYMIGSLWLPPKVLRWVNQMAWT